MLRDDRDVLHADVRLEESSGAISAASAGMLRVTRLSDRGEQRIASDGRRCGVVQYEQPSTGLVITVRCEGIEPGPPPARAFADPDDPDRSCLPAAELAREVEPGG